MKEKQFSAFLASLLRDGENYTAAERMTVMKDVDAFVGLLVLKYLHFEDFKLSFMLPAAITSSFVQFNRSTWWNLQQKIDLYRGQLGVYVKTLTKIFT